MSTYKLNQKVHVIDDARQTLHNGTIELIDVSTHPTKYTILLDIGNQIVVDEGVIRAGHENIRYITADSYIFTKEQAKELLGRLESLEKFVAENVKPKKGGKNGEANKE